MKISNFIGWIILILFSVLIAYMGIHAWHQAYLITFLIIILICPAIVVFLFSILKNVD